MEEWTGCAGREIGHALLSRLPCVVGSGIEFESVVS